jgi:hypothetical protein
MTQFDWLGEFSTGFRSQRDQQHLTAFLPWSPDARSETSHTDGTFITRARMHCPLLEHR